MSFACEPKFLCIFAGVGKPRRRWEGNIRMDLEEIGISCWELG
jgi:hypothetical protein